MLELVRVTRFKLITTFVVTVVIHLHGWIKPRVLTYYVENSELMSMSRGPEFQKLFQEFFSMVDPEMVQRITAKSFATNIAVVIALSYAAACIIDKLKSRRI